MPSASPAFAPPFPASPNSSPTLPRASPAQRDATPAMFRPALRLRGCDELFKPAHEPASVAPALARVPPVRAHASHGLARVWTEHANGCGGSGKVSTGLGSARRAHARVW